MINSLQLLSGIDIPFIGANLIIHQPTIKEISYIGEDVFFMGCEILNFSKENLSDKDKINLENKTNFDILMSILGDRKNPSAKKGKVYAMMVLSLIFPNYHIKIEKDCIKFLKENETEKMINSKNYEEFRNILFDMFCLNGIMGKDFDYNPAGDKAKEIAERFKKAREKNNKNKIENKKNISLLGKYASILSVGLYQDLNTILNYTIYQLFDAFKRFDLKSNSDMYIKAKLAGAKDIKEVDNWMEDIHS